MSDTASDPNIEDVLSSIRRLVSDEPMRARANPEDDAEGDNVERLVLTPDFRVHGELQAAQEDTEEAAEPLVLDQVVEPIDALETEEVAEPSENSTDEVGELDIPSEYQSDSEWSDEDLQAVEPPERDTDPVVLLNEAAPEIEESAEAVEPVSNEGQTLEERIAGLEAALENTQQEWEPDGSEDGSSDETTPIGEEQDAEDLAAALDVADPEVEIEASVEETDAEIIEFGSDSAENTPEPDNTNTKEAFEPISDEDISARMDEMFTSGEITGETAEATETASDLDDSDEPEFEMPKAEDRLSNWDEVALEAEPESEPETETAAEPEQEQSAQSAEDVDFDEVEEVEAEVQTFVVDPEAVEDAEMADSEDDEEADNIVGDDIATLDEEALRDIVTDIVREELQGVLGERITRNVRRLVRREIQRALAMRDLE